MAGNAAVLVQRATWCGSLPWVTLGEDTALVRAEASNFVKVSFLKAGGK